MRTRVPYNIFPPSTGGSNTIKITGMQLTIEDIRLVINETQKIILCSSMQKDLPSSVTIQGNDTFIVIPTTLCTLEIGDKITVEIDTASGNPASQSSVDVIAQRLNVADAYNVTLIGDTDAMNYVKNHLKNVYGTVSAQAGGTAADEHIAAAIVNLNGVPTKLYRHYLYAGSRKTITVTQGSQTMTIQVPDTGYGLTELWRKRTAAGTWVHYCANPDTQAGEQSIATLHPTLETYDEEDPTQIIEQDYIVTINPNQQ